MMTFILERNLIKNLSLLIIGTGSFLIIYIAWLLLGPQDPMKVVQPHRILTPVINQGERIFYEVEYCLEKDEAFIVERTLININSGELWDIPDRLNNFPAGCTKEVHDVLTPIRLDPGDYKMMARILIEVNSLRVIDHNFVTEQFRVNQI